MNRGITTRLLPVLGLVLALALHKAAADEIACTPSGLDPAKTGVVLLHGKSTFPFGGRSRIPVYSERVSQLASSLRAAGFRVSVPLMPWTRDRVYDRTYEEAMEEIADAAGKLKAEGVERIVIAGHSIGANAALGYAALKGGIAGVISLAMGHYPSRFRDAIRESVNRARAMVAAGKGGERASFSDSNMGSIGSVTTTAAHYLSFFDPDGNAEVQRNAARLPAETPLLWVVAENDPFTRLGKDYAFAKAPSNPLNRYVTVTSDHLDAPTAAIPVVVAWLKCL